MAIFFKSAEHKQRFLAAMHGSGKAYGGQLDQEYGAALYILTAEGWMWKEVSSYVESNGINIATILEDIHLSSGQSVLVRLAGNLFNSETHLDAIELMLLDDSNFQIVLSALRLRRQSLLEKDLS